MIIQKNRACIYPLLNTPLQLFFFKIALFIGYICLFPLLVLTPYFDLVSNLIAKGRRDSRELLGRDPYFICLPFTKEQQDWLFQFSDSWNAALAHFAGRLENHFPTNKLLHFASQPDFVFPSVVVSQPLTDTVTVFTDGSSNGKAAYVINDTFTSWFTGCSSAQEVELCAVFAVLQHFASELLNFFFLIAIMLLEFLTNWKLFLLFILLIQ